MGAPHATMLDADGLRRFLELRPAAVAAVSERFMTEHAATYAPLGARGREACREDLAFHLEFLRPVLEFGLLDPMVAYLGWLRSVLASRALPEAHVELSLQWLAEFYAAHLPAAAGKAVSSALQQARDALATLDPAASAPDAQVPHAWPECEAFEQALLAGDHRQAAAIIERCAANGRGLVGAEVHVVQPALYRIGRKWQESKVSVAQEHLATAIAQSAMSRALAKADAAPPNGRSVLLACVAGNHHAVGLQMVSDAFLLAGWDVQYLGPDVPTADLVRQAVAWRPRLVGLSVSFPQQLHEARAVIAALEAAMGAERPPVIVGGLAINHFGGLVSHLGAEGSSRDAASAVDSGIALTDSRS